MSYHPIYDTPIEKVFPFLCCCVSRKSKEVEKTKMKDLFGNNSKKAEKKLAALSEDPVGSKNVDDPIANLGVGMVNFRTSLFVLCLLFTVIAILSYPILKLYKEGEGMHKPH